MKKEAIKKVNQNVTWGGGTLLDKGFTLIELLAVIVILAIIALIATPIIMNVIESTKEASYDRSVESIMHSAEIFAMDMKVRGNLELDEDFYDEIVDEISGDRPEEGQVYINKYGEIALSLRYGDYCYTKSYGETSYYKEKTEGDCITPFYYLKKAVNSDSDDAQFLEGPIKRSEIEKIVTVATNIVPEDAIGSWDVTVDSEGKTSEEIKGKVMAWYKESGLKDADGNTLYEVYIGQEGGVKANRDSSALFRQLINVTEIDLSKLDTSNVTSMNNMFLNCLSLTNLNVSNFDTSKVTDMSHMFRSCENLATLDLSSFNTTNVTNMGTMFQNCSSLTSLDLKNFDTSNVTSMNNMFRNCTNLKTLNIKNFNTANVTDMGCLFYNCESLISIDVSNFDTKKVQYMNSMFRNCKSLKELSLNNFNTENVTTMTMMFYGISNLASLDLRSFDTSKVTNMRNIFAYSKNLTEILVSDKWNTDNADTYAMFTDCGTDHVTVQ